MLTPLTDDDPTTIGPYRLQNRIGEGGMGTVYLAFTADRQPVAVKLASAELSEDGEFRRRFQREVRAAQRVQGNAVAAVLDADTSSERPWMVTEYVEGISLADAVRQRGPLSERLIRALAAGLADALVAIHEAGVVHRDLKPSNVLLAWDGPKVIDFGIAQLDGNATLTRAGHVVGTLAWMAPEQMRGEPAGPAADIFSWGCCIAYTATGRHPFHAERAETLAFRIQRDLPDLENLPAYLHETVVPALDKEPLLRPSAAALLAALSGRPVRSTSEAQRATETVLERDWTGRRSSSRGQRPTAAGYPDQAVRQAAPDAARSPAPWAPAQLPPPQLPPPRPAPSPMPSARPVPPQLPPAQLPPARPSPARPVPAHPLPSRPLPERSLEGRPGLHPQVPGQPHDARWRATYAGSLGAPPPAEAYRPAPPAADQRWAPGARSQLPAGPSTGGPSHDQRPGGQRPAEAGHDRHPRLAPPVSPPAMPGQAQPVVGAGIDGRPHSPPPARAPATPAARAAVGRAQRARRPAGWNLWAVSAAVLAVLWLFGAGSIAGIYLGYRARVGADPSPRRGDRLAVVGVLLGWPGLIAALLYLGFAASRG